MTNAPNWHAKGQWFDVCKCRIPCPCTFAQPPTEENCEGIMAWHIEDGNYGDVDISGLNVVALATFEGNAWAGEAKNARMAMYIDAKGDDRQREALRTIWAGQAGGWMAGFSALIEEVLGVEFETIEFDAADDLSSWRVEIPGKVLGEAEALSGPTTPPGARVQVHNSPGSEVGPGQV